MKESVDNAANIVGAMQPPPRPQDPEYIEGESIRCACHVLNLVVTDVLGNPANGVDDIRDKARAVSTHFNHSSTSQTALNKEQSAAHERSKKLKADVVTRWNSFYVMLERLIEQKAHLVTVLNGHADRATRLLVPTPENWETMKDILLVLKPFYQATTALEGDVYPTLSLVHFFYAAIIHTLTGAITRPNFTPLATKLANALTVEMGKRWASTAAMATSLACMLDPRTKGLNMFPPTTHDEMWELLFREAFDYHKRDETHSPVASVAQAQTDMKDEAALDLFSALQSFHVPVQVHQPDAPSLVNDLRAEISSWKATPSAPLFSTKEARTYTDPLGIWSEYHDLKRFPLLTPLARKYLCIPATSVPSERVASAAGNVVTSKRARLNPGFVAKLTFAHMNWDMAELPSQKERQELANRAIAAAQAAMAAVGNVSM